MHISSNGDRYPALCYDVGMDCVSCVRATAHEAAKVCPGLQGKALGQIFVLLYPNSACAPMHKRFGEEYHSAPGDLDEQPFERKQHSRSRAKSRSAVA